MAIQKSNLNINFASGLDTKTDAFQVSPGKMLSLQNTIFSKGGLFQKRNGNQNLTARSATTSAFTLNASTFNAFTNPISSYLTTFNGNLTALGNTVNALSPNHSWLLKGLYSPLSLSTMTLIRSNASQVQVDSASNSNNITCTVYTENTGGSNSFLYVLSDSTTGQNLIAPTTVGLTVDGSPKVFVLGLYFIIVFPAVVAAANKLHYTVINSVTLTETVSDGIISANYTPLGVTAYGSSFDGVVNNDQLYVVWAGTTSNLTILTINSILTVSSPVTVATTQLSRVAINCDPRTNYVWVCWWQAVDSKQKYYIFDSLLNAVLTTTDIQTNANVLNITLIPNSASGQFTVFTENTNNYTFDSSIPTNLIQYSIITTTATSVAGSTLVRSIGLASKAFKVGSDIYFLGVYQSNFQPTLFLMKYILEFNAAVVTAKFSYENSPGYLAMGLPSVSVIDSVASIPYLFKDLIQSVNKSTNPAAGTQIAQIYAQVGINLVKFDFLNKNITSSEIGSNLNLSGGFLWAYDGYTSCEQSFFLFPDLDLNSDGTYHGITTATSGGHLTDNTQSFYVFTYEWQDNQGNLFRSAPSVPITKTTGNSGSNVNTNTIKVPMLRLTYKTANPAKIVGYRYSAAQPAYYQFTSITAPSLNAITSDFVTIVDTLSDASILGNNLLYTTGGVVENIGPPATNAMALFKSRLFLIDAEDDNLLWYSKQVIEATPVEMSDLFTLFVAPTTGAQGSTGGMKCVSAMDDKLIIFKKSSIYYLTGTGPDNTGANNDFSDPVFITSTVGCSNQNSIVFMPQGLMFQSNKGIWLLGRDLSTNYIGAPVEQFNSATVLSALNIPETNQVRFTLDSGVTLMYDYFYGQWGTFVGVPAISSTLYQELHTSIDTYGRIFQENPGSYLDGSNPVLMQFSTGWMNLAGLQGFQRAYGFYLLGTYLSPHKMTVSIAYDYNPSATQISIISPDNFTENYGLATLYGSTPFYGGLSNIEQWRVDFERQKCQAFQLSIQESYDSSYGVAAGAGFTLSGLDLIVGAKSGYPRLKAANSIG